MNTNIGTVDRVLRLVAALVLFSLFFILPGNQKWFGLIGFVPLVTALVGWCPLYSMLGIRSNRSKA